MHPLRADLISYPWNARILDATGRVRHCRLLVSRENLRKYPSPLPKPLAKHIRGRMQLAIALPWALPSGLFVAAIIFIPPAVMPHRSGRLDDSIWVAGWAAIYAICAAAYLTIGCVPLRRIYRRAHTAALLEIHRCPWCLYDLESIPPDDHALTTCPECGGLWRLPPPAPGHEPPASRKI